MDIQKKNQEYETMQFNEIIRDAIDSISNKVAVSFSGQLHDTIIVDFLCKSNIKAKLYTIDTGRLNEETYKLIDIIENRYDIRLEKYFPNYEYIQDLVNKKGLYSFRDSVENRKECCHIRKVEPNQRALKGVELWITGLSRDQSNNRQNIPIISFDKGLNIFKLAPLANVSLEKVWEHTRSHKLYFNELYNHGYQSIGCAPCSRPVKNGEDARSGRWWWESADSKECGLHVSN